MSDVLFGIQMQLCTKRKIVLKLLLDSTLGYLR